MNQTESFQKKCLRCGHFWVKRTLGRPQVCPFCGSRHWDEAKEVTIVVPPAPEPEKTKRFAVPVMQEVAEFWRSQDLAGSPEEFFDFYSSKGWKVGSSPMKDWKAAARNWSRRELKRASKGEIAAAVGRGTVQVVDPEVLPPEVPRGTVRKLTENDVREYLRTHPEADETAIWESFNRAKAQEVSNA